MAEQEKNVAQEPTFADHGPPGEPAQFHDDDDRPKLNPEDQQRVDAFLSRGVNSVPRKPFKPLILLAILIVIVGTLGMFSQWLAHTAGIF
ncbi:MAG: hypothetical protein ACI87W_002365 [Halieaceae bacterium]|jgi:hypothetical protein